MPSISVKVFADLVDDIINAWINLSNVSAQKDSVSFDGLDDNLISSFANFLDSLEDFFER